jgi:hypothetical protein
VERLDLPREFDAIGCGQTAIAGVDPVQQGARVASVTAADRRCLRSRAVFPSAWELPLAVSMI